MAGGKELVAGTKCYVPDDQFVWLPAQIVREEKSNDPSKPEKTVVLKVFPANTVAQGDGGSPPSSSNAYQERVMDFNDKNVKALMKSLQLESLPYQNEDLGEFGIEDMIALNYLHEAAILYNVKKRFLKRLPYTYTGDICIAVNPYQWLPELYAEDIHAQYLTKNRDELPPHVYATSVASYNDMKRNAVNQSILVSGESGAGKTETTKILMNHLASIAGGLNDNTIKKIIEVNPLLESFGNAKTVRNDNSSRFGKFTQLQFDKAGILVGARCRTYLLEKTRVIHHESPERNYHIFYQILESTSAPKWYLDNSKSYTYTGDNTAMKIEGISDEAHFERTRTALGLIGLSYEEQEVLFEVLAGILHLGEIKINKKNGNDEEAVIAPNDPAAVSTTALFGISVEDLETALCSRKIAVSGEILKKHLRKEQAEECRDALAKATYSNIFDWLVSVINASLENDKKMRNHVGILDIFGFEHFKHNSFEQFCINYANEKLQQKFTQDVFKTVQLEYEAEGIIWSHIDFADNQDVISIIEDRLGIISLLNDEVMRPKGNDESLVSKLASIHKEDKHVIEFPRTSRTQFTIKHYAAAVTYESLGFLEKHKDALLPDLSDLMRSSSKSFLCDIFAAKGGEAESSAAKLPQSGSARRGGGRAAGGALSVANVGTQFKDNLNELMTSIRQTKVHYVRCIKPNQNKSPHEMDQPMVVAQLRCAGVIEAIRISRVAYPNRHLLEELLDKFWVFDKHRKTDVSLADRCQTVMEKMSFSKPTQYQIGRTRIYFRYGVLEEMEERKAVILDAEARRVQHLMRGFCERLKYLRKLRAIIKLQSVARCVVMMNRYNSFMNALTVLQARWRGYQGRLIAIRAKKTKSAITIQRHIRGFVKRKQFMEKRKSVVKTQAFVRMKIQRQKYQLMLSDKKVQDNIASQLQDLQSRLHDEQRRNAELKMERDSNHRDSLLFNETNGARSRGKSTAHLWMADADDIIGQLNGEATRLRKKNDEQRARNTLLKNEIEKLKNEKEVIAANYHVKIRQFEDLIREKDKKLAAAEQEVAKLRQRTGSTAPPHSLERQKSMGSGHRKSIFRTLGSKKDSANGSGDYHGDYNRGSMAVHATLAQKSADTAQFLKNSARRMSRPKFWGNGGDDDSDRLSDGAEVGGRKSLLQEVGAAGVGAMTSLKGRLSAVKGKYYGDGMADQLGRPGTEGNINGGFNLDAMPEAPLPPGWEARLSRSKGKVYFCNPSLKLTQWDRPTVESLKAKKQAAAAAQRARK
ncbi:Myosin-like protein, partial [Globisporangium splendens]